MNRLAGNDRRKKIGMEQVIDEIILAAFTKGGFCGIPEETLRQKYFEAIGKQDPLNNQKKEGI